MIHGHELLIKYLKEDTKLNNKILIEIGSVREILPKQNSTREFAKFCKENKMIFYSVDMDPENTENVIKICKELDYIDYYAITMKGEDFLLNFDKEIDYIYLDAFDYYHEKHSKKRKEKYLNILNCEINNDNCHKMHLECCKNGLDKFKKETKICFDDIFNCETYDGKGYLAIPYLLEKGYEIKEFVNYGIILQQKII